MYSVMELTVLWRVMETCLIESSESLVPTESVAKLDEIW
jgi:hypothetical protein